MADNKMRIPGGMGGIVRYDEEYKSKFMLSPTAVVGFIIATILFVIVLKIFLPITG